MIPLPSHWKKQMKERLSRHLALMVLNDVESSANEEKSHEESVKSSNESSSSIACLTNVLSKSKSRVKDLQHELKSRRNENVPCVTCLYHEIVIDELKCENDSLKLQVEDIAMRK